RRGHLFRRERLAGLRGGDRVSVTEIPVIAGGDRAHRDGSAEQLSLESLDLGLRIEDVDHPDGEPARLRPRARDRGLDRQLCELGLGHDDDDRLRCCAASRSYRSTSTRDWRSRGLAGIAVEGVPIRSSVTGERLVRHGIIRLLLTICAPGCDHVVPIDVIVRHGYTGVPCGRAYTSLTFIFPITFCALDKVNKVRQWRRLGVTTSAASTHQWLRTSPHAPLQALLGGRFFRFPAKRASTRPRGYRGDRKSVV